MECKEETECMFYFVFFVIDLCTGSFIRLAWHWQMNSKIKKCGSSSLPVDVHEVLTLCTEQTASVCNRIDLQPLRATKHMTQAE